MAPATRRSGKQMKEEQIDFLGAFVTVRELTREEYVDTALRENDMLKLLVRRYIGSKETRYFLARLS